MKKMSDELQIFPSAAEDDLVAFKQAESKQTRSEAYRIAYTDRDFLLRDETRPEVCKTTTLTRRLSFLEAPEFATLQTPGTNSVKPGHNCHWTIRTQLVCDALSLQRRVWRTQSFTHWPGNFAD